MREEEEREREGGMESIRGIVHCKEIFYPKRNFQVFSTPNVHSHVIASDVKEIFPIYCKQPSSHCWRLHFTARGRERGRGERGETE